MTLPHLHRITLGSIAWLAAFSGPLVRGAVFQWNNATGNWSSGASWTGGVAPTGTAGDVLVFSGDQGTTAGTPPHYSANNDFAGPFSINALQLNATDASGLPTDPALVISGNALRFSGSAPEILQSGAGAFTLTTPFEMPPTLRFAGNGTGVVTLNRGISGLGTIVKDGTSVFRFGTFPPPPVPPATTSNAPSENTWYGPLVLSAGVVRFNNNADSGRTALRGNPVTLATGATLTCSSELRVGTLSGTGGTVESLVTGTASDSQDIVLSTVASGDFGGTIRLNPPAGTGNDLGALVVRGPGVQTVSGTLAIDKDVAIGGTLVIDGTASLDAQTKGAIVMNGGTLRLENATTGLPSRLRNGSSTSTGVDVIGGGTFHLSGHPSGSSEVVSRLMLASLTGGGANKPRSGQLNIRVTHRSASQTSLIFQSYQRDATVTRALNTVRFEAENAAGAVITLGAGTPQINFVTTPVLSNALLSSSAGTASVGWATVLATDGIAFATHGLGGVGPVTTTAFAPATSSATVNSLLTAPASVTLATYSQNSVRILPSAAGGTLTLAAATNLNTTAIALAGAQDFTISGGTWTGGGPRFAQIEKATLSVASGLGNAQSLVKAGGGVLALTNPANHTASLQPVVINEGALRATPGTTLPGGELRFRGGILEISGGNFARPFLTGAAPGSPGAGTVNWTGLVLNTTTSTIDTVPEDRGSGGFAAVGTDCTIDLGPAGTSTLLWEEKGFVQSAFALILGSPRATARTTLTDNLSLSSGENTTNYNAREIRVPDNSASSTDRAVLAGVVSGTIYNDLLKTGDGTLELTAANTFGGATIIHGGTIVLSGTSNSTIVNHILPGATLAGSGSTGPILLGTAGKISPGDNSGGTLTATKLLWQPGGTARFDLAPTGGDRLALGAGSFEKSGTSGTHTFDFGGTGAANQVYTLVTFGSTSFTASDFTAANLAAGVTGHFILTANSLQFSTMQPPPIDSWRTSYFGQGAGNSGTSADAADPDKDGLANLAEYVLGGHPLTPATTVAPTFSVPTGVGRLSFTRNIAATDVVLRIEARNSLTSGTWLSIASLPAGSSVWTLEPGVTVTDPGTGPVTVNDLTNTVSAPQRFMRLAIERP